MNTSPWRTHKASAWSSFAGHTADSPALRHTPTRCSTDPARPPRRSQTAPDALLVPSPKAKVAAAGSAPECTDEKSSACRAVSQPELPHPVRTAPRPHGPPIRLLGQAPSAVVLADDDAAYRANGGRADVIVGATDCRQDSQKHAGQSAFDPAADPVVSDLHEALPSRGTNAGAW